MTGGIDIAALKAALAAAEAKASDAAAEIAFLRLTIEKLRRELYGWRSERKSRLLDQLELQLDELEASATEDELAAELAVAGTTEVKGFTRRKPARKPFPAHLPRERVVVPPPTSCACCGSDRLSKIGEDVTETLEAVPRRWKVIQTVREKFTCRHCEKISQPPAPFHPTPRGWAEPNLLATIVFEKYGQHQPLNRQRDRYAREGVDLSLSTLADQVGACAVAKAMDYMLRRWDRFARFLEDGRICLTNNAAERALRGIALGRKSWLFCGSDRGGVRAAAMYTLIGTAKLNDVDPQAWLADVLGKIAGTPQSQLDELLPWNWQDNRRHDRAA